MKEKGCSECWHNYDCPMPQEGYDFNPDDCPYNHDRQIDYRGLIEKGLALEGPEEIY